MKSLFQTQNNTHNVAQNLLQVIVENYERVNQKKYTKSQFNIQFTPFIAHLHHRVKYNMT